MYQELEHDKDLIASLRAATFTEERDDNGDIIIRLAHLFGRISISADDRVLKWSLLGQDGSGASMRWPAGDPAELAVNWEAGYRDALKLALLRLADEVIVGAERRMTAS